MDNNIDPRVFLPNFALQVPSLPAALPTSESRPLNATPPDSPAMRGYQPMGVPPMQSPSYGPRVREPQETLQIRRPAAAGPDSRHPYKMSVVRESGENRLYLQFGGLIMPFVLNDGGSAPIFHGHYEIPRMSDGSHQMVDDPDDDGSNVGYEVLDTSTTYGIWIKITALSNLEANAAGSDIGAALYGWFDQAMYGPVGSGPASGKIVASDVFTDRSDIGGIIASTSGFSYAWVGQVAIDADDAATIKQWLRADYHVPHWTMPFGFAISADADSSDALQIGSDGKIKYVVP